MTILLAENNLIPQVVAVAALAVDDVTEQPQLDHMHDHHLSLTVAAVLQQHERGLCALIGTDKLPAIIHGVGTAHLHSNGDSPLHGINGDGKMGLPSRHDEHSVHVIAVKDFLVIGGGKGAVPPAVNTLGGICGAGHAILVQVADRGDFYVIHM